MTVPLYRNPIARDGDFADPFVLRHDGRYYLYGTNPDVRCWSSDDLISWTLEGPTIAPDEFPGLVPFAPEVVYADGAFLMYTSPSGHGHRVLRADAPTGPFRAITGNVGHAIDGNVLIDDDGRWYFYWAGDEGIWGCEMPSPTEFGEPVLTGVHMNGWTEGPFVTRRGDGYVMTLTGNHYLSPGYRIDAAFSDDPLRGWRSDPLNPVLVSTEGPTTGLGHSSSVRGPDLVSTYLVYHNLNPDASRDLDLDRQVANDRTIQVLGPSTSAPVPAAPDAVWTDRLSPALGPVVTAELNLTPEAGADGWGLALEGDGGSVELRVDRASGAVVASSGAVVASSGAVELDRAALPASFAHDALHCWRVVVAEGELRLAVDGRHQFAAPYAAPGVFRIRVLGEVRVGHCAATAATEADADRRAVVPVPGRFWATLSPGATELVRETPDAVYDSVALGPGTRLDYRLHLQRDLEPVVHLTGAFREGDELVLGLDGQEGRAVRVPGLRRVLRVPLPPAAAATGGADGVRTLTVEARAGRPVLTLVTVTDAALAGGAARLGPLTASGFDKRTVTEGVYDDLTVAAELSLAARPGGHADLLLRASELSEGGEGDDTRLGIHFLLGYSVQLHPDRVVLARHGYDERVLAECPFAEPLAPGAPHRLVVHADGSRLSVELDGAHVLDHDDRLPHLLGRVGIRAVDAELHVHELHVDPNDTVHP
ncbi:MAG: glycoside hydrolase family 43 protein [Micrococcales bacterium]|nr:glycoside hydrolase family 43 protein [Micrococcales bacterium]OJX66601.1 MAG: hypothetical protein BGO94_07035 [Micrococcales bacterium 72-143]